MEYIRGTNDGPHGGCRPSHPLNWNGIARKRSHRDLATPIGYNQPRAVRLKPRDAPFQRSIERQEGGDFLSLVPASQSRRTRGVGQVSWCARTDATRATPHDTVSELPDSWPAEAQLDYESRGMPSCMNEGLDSASAGFPMEVCARSYLDGFHRRDERVPRHRL